MKYLTFALAKGRLAKKTLELLEQIGITMEEMKDPDMTDIPFQLQFGVFIQSIRCANLCGIRCGGYRCCR